MPVKILMPALSPTMTEGKLAKWLKAEGDEIVSGDIIAEIETDKATMEVEAVDEGVLAKIVIPEGTDHVPVNDLIAVLLEEGEDDGAVEKLLAGGNDNATAPAAKEAVKADAPKAAPVAAPAPAPTAAPAPIPATSASRILASPLAKRLAEQAGLNLANIQGSGPNGRIVKADIENAKTGGTAQKSAAAPQSATFAPASSGPDAAVLAEMLGIPHHLQENSGMRKTIARRLLESKQTVPHYYLTVDCVLDKLLDLRKQINNGADGLFKLSVNDFIVKATALALKKVPAVNTSWTDNALVIYDRADVSVAVAIPDGLITPIVKDADNKSLKAISAEVKDLAARAKDGKLKPEEYQGGTISVSNLGMFGIKEFVAIINPPQSCILAVGAGDKRPIVKDGALAIGTVMTATASFDHRAVDGAVGAQFLEAFKNLIENPLTMLA
ncbi:MAG: pyruvate dehydrogenase complex dihydrolipoamide acetyltransferase [Pseudomonadota bacterium]|nr:pyruvate dehydrogenase complex dihydrolipoamide acetyltransferase [Pseudomonadota bacterium]QKK04227.1 MAG: pyruvate dehydrogenase complex dihydrolipoamide acetyltransferase [Pseudomonadota bacterium]